MFQLPAIVEQSHEKLESKLPPRSAATLRSIFSQLAQSNERKSATSSAHTLTAAAAAAEHDDASRLNTASPLTLVYDDDVVTAAAASAALESADKRQSASTKHDEVTSRRSSKTPGQHVSSGSPRKSGHQHGTGSDSFRPATAAEDIEQNDDGESLCEEPVKPPRPYENNRFGSRISREHVLFYVQNKQTGFIPGGGKQKPTDDAEEDTEQTAKRPDVVIREDVIEEVSEENDSTCRTDEAPKEDEEEVDEEPDEDTLSEDELKVEKSP